MWKCKKCNEQLEDQYDACWKCGSGRDGDPPSSGREFETLAEQLAAESEELSGESPRYKSKVSYDARVICRFADMLYDKASWIVFLHAVAGCVVGAMAGYLLGGGFRLEPVIAAVIGGVVGVIVGILLGEARAFWYRLTAQIALCQVEIEKNTRRGAAANRKRESPQQ